MSDTEMVIVHVENDEATAQIVVSYLQSEGIEAMISEDDAGDQLPSLESGQLPVGLQKQQLLILEVWSLVLLGHGWSTRRLLSQSGSPPGPL